MTRILYVLFVNESEFLIYLPEKNPSMKIANVTSLKNVEKTNRLLFNEITRDRN